MPRDCLVRIRTVVSRQHPARRPHSCHAPRPEKVVGGPNYGVPLARPSEEVSVSFVPLTGPATLRAAQTPREGTVEFADAVVDAMPRGAPAETATAPTGRYDRDVFARRLQDVVARHRGDRSDLPQLVTLSLRVEADEEELVAGACRLVLQVHDERDPLHVRDAASLWHDPSSVRGFG